MSDFLAVIFIGLFLVWLLGGIHLKWTYDNVPHEINLVVGGK